MYRCLFVAVRSEGRPVAWCVNTRQPLVLLGVLAWTILLEEDCSADRRANAHACRRVLHSLAGRAHHASDDFADRPPWPAAPGPDCRFWS